MAYIHNRYLDAEERYEVYVVKAAERPHLLHWTANNNCKEQTNNISHEHDDDDDEKKVDDHDNITTTSSCSAEEYPPPLTDGCDIPGWRCQRISPCMNSTTNTNYKEHRDIDIDIDSPLGGTLHIGASSSLFRRESQFPFITPSSLCSKNSIGQQKCCWWYSAKERYNIPPSKGNAALTIEYDEACKLVDYNNGENTTRQITMFCKEYEIKNRPVKIFGACTDGWAAMPNYVEQDECDNDTATDDEQQRELAQDDNVDDNRIEWKDQQRRALSQDHFNNVDDDRIGWKDVNLKSKLFTGEGRGGWTFSNLLSRYGNISFRFSDTHGEMMSLSTYAKYITSPEGICDDSPLGIYDSEFGDVDSPTNELLNEYTVPKCFSDDLFDVVDENDDTATTTTTDKDCEEKKEPHEYDNIPSRPPYRWVLIGPEQSGTGMHVDPLWTNAWVTVLQGAKRWLLFPPNTPYESIGMIENEPQIPSSIWFRDYYDKVTSSSWPSEYKPVEVLQHPGETVYVPAGWPHLVLNLELTVAVTHNYASEFGPFFERMCEEMKRDEPEFALRWYEGLKRAGREDLIKQMSKTVK